MRRLLLVALLLTGCSSAPPQAWMIYSRAAYLYGRMEAKVETACSPPAPPDLTDLCTSAAGVQKEVKTLNPVIQAELSKEEPDWGRIMQYLDLVIGLAAKLAVVP